MDKRRRILKIELFAERNGKCELCGERATDLHEILPRSAVHKSLRHLLFVPELCSILCNRCNVNYADTKENRAILLRKNVDRYGVSVKHALRKLEDASKCGIGLALPDL